MLFLLTCCTASSRGFHSRQFWHLPLLEASWMTPAQTSYENPDCWLQHCSSQLLKTGHTSRNYTKWLCKGSPTCSGMNTARSGWGNLLERSIIYISYYFLWSSVLHGRNTLPFQILFNFLLIHGIHRDAPPQLLKL